MRPAARTSGILIPAILVLALSWSAAIAARPASALARASGEVTFSIGDGVTPEDEMLIREGVRLAQDFLADELGVEVRERTIVNARATTPEDAPLVGMAGTNWVGLYTGSEGWLVSPPALRLHVVVHEFVHLMQHELIGDGFPVTPLWLDEGLAEYLAFRALARLDLVELEDVDAYQAYGLTYGPWLPGLSALESYDGFQSQDGAVYPLAYFAARELVGELELRRVARYYEAIGDGGDWQTAFAGAFDRDPAAFYGTFEQVRATIAGPSALPSAFRSVFPLDVAATVWPAPVDGPVARGDQALVVAKTGPAARCALVVTSPAGKPALDQPAYADAVGMVFWLWTVPTATNRGTAKATLSCGGKPVTVKLKVT